MEEKKSLTMLDWNRECPYCGFRPKLFRFIELIFDSFCH